MRPEIEKALACLSKDELVDLTAALVKLNTVWDPESGACEQPAVDLVAGWAKKEGFTFVMDSVAPGRSNLVITLTGEPGERRLMFEGHTDVVAVGDRKAWKHDPFGAEIVGDLMYGRGTNDTKGNLAALLVAMAAIKRSGVRFAGTIVGGVLCDEEDGMLGVRSFIDNGHADKVTGAIICEPEENYLCFTQKGAIRARYTISGRMCHGAMPLSGLNPAPAVSRLIDALYALEMAEIEAHGKDEHLGWPSVTPTVVLSPAHPPAQLNVVPASAQIQVDLRTTPAQDHEHLKRELSALAQKVEEAANAYYREYDARLGNKRDCDLGVSVEFITQRPATLTDREDPLVKAADTAIREITGREPVYAGVPGATDGTFLWLEKDIPLVTTGAGDVYVPHQVDEWVSLSQLYETAKIYVAAALEYLKPE